MRDTGIYKNIKIDEYHKEEGISSTGISLILDCPKRYYHEFIGAKERKETDCMLFGSAFHSLLLEPEKFHDEFYTVKEEYDLRTKIGKEMHEAVIQSANGRRILRGKMCTDLFAMVNEAKTHPVWQHLRNGEVENSIYWNYGIDKVRLRSRPDIYSDVLILDLKTTDSIANFQRSLYKYGYHRQAAMQIDGLKHFENKERHFAYFVIEKKEPYLMACFTLDPASLEQGRREYQDGAAIYHQCMTEGRWPGYDKNFQLTSIPVWAMTKEESL